MIKIKTIKTWLFFLTIAVLGIVAVVIFKVKRTTVTYEYIPGKESEFVAKIQGESSNSPIIEHEGEKMLLLNQPKTSFTAKLAGSLGGVTIRVYYDSMAPQKLVISTDRSRSLPFLMPGEITIYKRLQERNWGKEEGPFPEYPELDFYSNPHGPDYFPSLIDLLEGQSLEEVVRRIYAENTIFVVKGDKNTQHQSLSDDHDLDFIQYILLPHDLEKYRFQFVRKPQSGPLADYYVVELEEDVFESVHQRGAEYNFALIIERYDENSWMRVEKIEVIGKRG